MLGSEGGALQACACHLCLPDRSPLQRGFLELWVLTPQRLCVAHEATRLLAVPCLHTMPEFHQLLLLGDMIKNHFALIELI